MIHVVDDLLADPVAYREAVLAQPFGDVEVGVTFHGIAHPPDCQVVDAIAGRWPALEPRVSVCRLSPEGQVEPNYIHSDLDMGDWTAILYLTPDPPVDDGTTFWRRRETGAVSHVASSGRAAQLAEGRAWRDVAQWEPVQTVAARFNRLLIFTADRYHSRAIFENYGHGRDARLIQLVFGTGVLQ